ncbi:histidine kinase [Paraflavitalea soli]|uniref:Histidine kinase n=1 Tax=Paraflavitalea soli TaxID=2315862 RepID=A0A3B7MT07_9BACT|nr:histidine kinase [Paraflavitalea soli]AXY76389.1 histidine kinase [Paraflavitalea soli]
MRKHLFRIFLLLLSFEVIEELGSNIPKLIRNQPAFTSWQDRNDLLLRLSGFIILLLYPVVSYIIFRKNFHKNKKLAFLYWAIGITLIITLRYTIEQLFFPAHFGFRNYPSNVSWLYYFADNLFFAFLYSAFGGVYFFIQNEQEYRMRESQLQLVNKQTELSFLRSQINPHFLFNSLNNIYSLVYHHSDQSLTAIAKLSDLLRYMLYDSNEKVPLQKELDYIEKYMELQQMRFDHPLPVKLELTGNPGKASIPPLLLIPFVENAFKHGDTKNGNEIRMKLHADEALIRFGINNVVGNHQKDTSGGIGLENVQRRLELLYPGRHSLHIKKTKDIFEVELEIRK